MKIIKHLTFAALAATLLFQTPIAQADEHGPQQITFEKCFVADDNDPFGGYFQGTAEGDCGQGSVIVRFVSLIPGKSIWRFAAEYAVTIPGCSFKTVCVGIEDVRTGHIVVNGVVTEVTEGELILGAQVQVRAQDNEDLTCSHGTITITRSEPE